MQQKIPYSVGKKRYAEVEGGYGAMMRGPLWDFGINKWWLVHKGKGYLYSLLNSLLMLCVMAIKPCISLFLIECEDKPRVPKTFYKVVAWTFFVQIKRISWRSYVPSLLPSILCSRREKRKVVLNVVLPPFLSLPLTLLGTSAWLPFRSLTNDFRIVVWLAGPCKFDFFYWLLTFL